jgi:NADPH-dependent curcumin reductase CurA
MRGRMTKADSYVQPFEIGKPIVSHVVAKVIDMIRQGNIPTTTSPFL